jgi:hypothetical protein
VKTQLNADVALMNVPLEVMTFEILDPMPQIEMPYVHLRHICVHLRFQSFSSP